MKHFKNLKFKNLKKQSMIKYLAISIIILLFSVFSFYTLQNQDQSLPYNPLSVSAENTSQVPLSGDYKDLLDDSEDEESDDEQEEKEKEEDVEQEDEGNTVQDDNELENTEPEMEQQELIRTNDGNNGEQNTQEERDNGTNDSGIGSGEHAGTGVNGDNETPSATIEISKPDENLQQEINHYFVTSITHGETVANESYTFDIKQLDHPYDIQNIEVELNSSTAGVDYISEDWNTIVNVSLSLIEGENEITVGVTYEEEDENTFTVFQNYTVIYDEDVIVIQTDLENREVYHETLRFQASAVLGDESIPIEVTVNGETISGEANSYETQLEERENTIVLVAEYKDLKASETYSIYYDKPNLTIETDLKDQTVTSENFAFTAKAFDGSERVNLTIQHNEESIEENEEGNYSVTLLEGDNTFKLTASQGDVTHTESYLVHYSPAASKEKEAPEENEHAPTITVHDLKDGETIKNATRTFHVQAYTYDGKSVTANNGTITATNNGEIIPMDWQDGAQISFVLNLQSGENHIEITATDNEGNTAIDSLVVIGDIAEEGDVVGTITFSLEASTIGLGHIIPPQEVEVYQGERGSHVITRVLDEYGITYDYTGEHENSFYLSAIYKEGLVTNPVIPEDLAELVERDFSRFDRTDYYTDSLGEFDFSNGAGWMYSVNGNYPNVGFADYYFKDGDVVRIRFTLAYGADIGGGMPGTNYGKEW